MEELLPRHADWKTAAWLLEKQFPHELAPYDRRPLPIGSFFLNSLARSISKEGASITS